jgi:glycosyl transferase family 25
MPSDLPPIWVVSLARATDRREFVDRAFREADLPFEIVPAVDGRALSAAEVAVYSSRRAMFDYGRELTRGLFACALSHLRVLQRMVDERVPEVLVFEDDTRPTAAFATILRERDSFPPDRDVVTFHSLFDWASPVAVDGRNIVVDHRVCRYERTPMGTQAYLITLPAAERVLDVAYPVSLPPDELLYRPRPAALRVYGIEPSPVVHEEFVSEVRAPAPPLRVHGPATRAALEAVRFSGRVRRRVDDRWRQRDRATSWSTASQRSATAEIS